MTLREIQYCTLYLIFTGGISCLRTIVIDLVG